MSACFRVRIVFPPQSHAVGHSPVLFWVRLMFRPPAMVEFPPRGPDCAPATVWCTFWPDVVVLGAENMLMEWLLRMYMGVSDIVP